MKLKSSFTLHSTAFVIALSAGLLAQPALAQPASTNIGIEPIPGSPTNILVTTTMTVEGSKIVAYKGMVRGVTVRQPTIMQGFKASFKSIVGGTIGSYQQMCEQARQEAYDMMVARAVQLGANAVVGVQYDSSAYSASSTEMGSEVVAYGTAVVIERQ